MALFLALAAGPAGAQESDVSQTPNAEQAGIKKSLQEQVGPGQGDVNTPESSVFVIKRDPFRAISRGRQLFQRKFTAAQGLGPRTGDGVGDIGTSETGIFEASVVAGLSDSCATCHGRPRGSAGTGGNVFTRPDSRDAPHLFGIGLVEMLADEVTADLRAIRAGAREEAEGSGAPVTAALVSKDIDYGALTAFPDGRVDTSRVEGVDPDLRVDPFFAEGEEFALRTFIVGALNAEMGLESPDPILLAAHRKERVESPAGMVLDGMLDAIPTVPVQHAGEDGDGDGVANEIDPALIDYLEFYLLNYFRPALYLPDATLEGSGRRLMHRVDCTSCHRADLVVERDRRVADVDTTYDPDRGGFNGLFATAAGRFVEVEDSPSFSPLLLPAEEPFLVRNIFTDLKRHDLGPDFWERNFNGTLQKEHVTEPLWGVGTTAPYGHDGRSINLREVILRHGGEAQASRDAFAALPTAQQETIIAFLQALVLFPPQDTASNLDPGDAADPDYPQFGHGGIALSVLFNDPSDPE
ncbi:MAG TPA: di-heme oxidoredictase family protein [Geminicoccaceae bacterium]|nr:di-heme oxidoredictase family protein [Geminicoccaceae bacterium]